MVSYLSARGATIAVPCRMVEMLLSPLASQEQTPDYAAAERLFEEGADLDWLNDGNLVVNVLVRKVVDAALVGFHPQNEGDER